MPRTAKARHFARDAFARGEYHRISNPRRFEECQWDGQRKKNTYAFVWEPDDRNECPPRMPFGGLKYFCNFTCYRSYYG